MSELTATANVRGRAIDLALAWADPEALARNLVIVRRRWGYPGDSDDGLVVVDLTDLFTPDGAAPWGRIDRARFILPNPRAEGGLLQAEVTQYFTAAGDADPQQVVIALHDDATGEFEETVLRSVVRVTSTTGSSPGFGAVTTLTIDVMQPDRTVARAGTLLISTQGVAGPGAAGNVVDYTQPSDDPAAGPDAPLVTPTPGSSLGRLDWTPAVASAAAPASDTRVARWRTFGWNPAVATTTTLSVSFAEQQLQSTVATVRSAAPLDVSFVTTADGIPIRTVELTEEPNVDTSAIERTIAVSDREPPTRTAAGFAAGLQPGLTYYYAVFQETGDGQAATPRSIASALATGSYGFAERLYNLLPAIHRYFDDPAGGRQGTWQLRRFLEIFGAGLDHARSLAEALPALQDIFEAGARYLPPMGRLIGWETDRTLPVQRQRTDILFAPEVFSTVGTVPNVRAMVTRATGWECQVKEFVNNVFFTNVPQTIPYWELWEADSPSSVVFPFVAGSPVTPQQVTAFVGASIDARPTLADDPNGASPWLFWQSDRDVASQSQVRERIWMMQLNGTDSPRPVMADSGALVDDQPAAIVDVIGNAGVMRLFWSSDRGQGRSIYTLVITNGVPGPAVRLTNHPSGNDQYPAVVKDFDGTLWLFWQSSRRGPTDIWAMTFARNATDWSGPQRITSGQPADTTPSAVIGADGHLQLFWTAARGSGSRIFQSVFDGTTWSVGVDFLASLPGADPAPPTTSKIRDEAPAALAFQGLCVYWQSDLDGTPHIYTTQQGGVHGETWSPPFRVTAGNAPEREPRAYRWHGALRLFFRTQRPAQQPASSLTVDFSNLGNMKRGQPDDQWHYTYSTTEPAAASSLAEDPVYARDAVGLYLTPDAAAGGADHRAVVSRAQAFIEPFRPANVRLLWFLPPGDPAA